MSVYHAGDIKVLTAEGKVYCGGEDIEDVEKLKAAPGPEAPEPKDEIRTVEIAVFGAGAGGLAAAIEAKEGGADVILIEKQGITGGSTARSGGKLLGAGTKWQKKQGIFHGQATRTPRPPYSASIRAKTGGPSSSV